MPGGAGASQTPQRAQPQGGAAETPSWLGRKMAPGMAGLGKLFRTTTFKLTLAYLTVFALFAAFLLGYFAWNTRRLVTEQITETVNAEVEGLAEQYRQGGI